MSDRFWIGADPGGSNAFGLAWLYESGETRTACVSSADEAVALIDQRPLAAGVDAPLWWSSGRSSDRRADQWIRKAYRIGSGTVQAANSLRGAALVQGAMFVARLRERFADLPVTEAHPKATAVALGGWSSQNVLKLLPAWQGVEHERDAIFAAIAAREGFSGRWSRDLSLDRHEAEQNPGTYWLSPIHYYWPSDSGGA